MSWLSGTARLRLAKGGVYINNYCWVVRAEGGRLAEVTGYFDTAAVNALFACQSRGNILG